MTRPFARALWLVTFWLVLAPKQVRAQEPLQHLSQLSKFENPACDIYFNPAVTTTIPQNVDSASHPGTALRAIQTKININATDNYVIDCDPGPSGDPSFVIHRKDAETLHQVADIAGSELIVPGDGFIYTKGYADEFFVTHRKYVLKEGTLVEVPQPYYFVGISTVNTRPMSLYTDTTYQNAVADLPSDTKIEVLVAKEGTRSRVDFLVKSPYGLVGWVAVGFDGCGSELMKDICFHGD